MTREIQPSDSERERLRSPSIIHGLFVAAGNHVRYFRDIIDAALDPNPNAEPPIKRPNFELTEALQQIREA